jgi:hypothetical protein
LENLDDPEDDYILNLLDCDTLFIFTNSIEELKDFKNKLNSSDIPILKIGKSFQDDIFNMIFLEEKLKYKIILLTIKYDDVNHEKLFQLSKNSNLLMEKLLEENKSPKVEKSLVDSINYFLLGILVYVKSFILRKKLELRFTCSTRKKNLEIEAESENFI